MGCWTKNGISYLQVMVIHVFLDFGVHLLSYGNSSSELISFLQPLDLQYL